MKTMAKNSGLMEVEKKFNLKENVKNLIRLIENLTPLLTPVVSDFALNADGDKNPWARVSVGLSNMNLTSGQAYY